MTNIPLTKAIDDKVNEVDYKQIVDMYDLIPGILFWIKDLKGKFVYCNQYFVEHSGKKNKEQVIGLTDFDLNPAYMAKQFVNDDIKVQNGELVTDRLEINHNDSGDNAWFTTSKRALMNSQNQVIGTYGITRYIHQSMKESVELVAVQKPVDYIRENFSSDISVKELAEHSNLSVSALERRFKKHLRKSPLQFINEVRLENARKRLIETNHSIAAIANECGFSEHSYFSSQFSKFFKVLPSEIRKEHKKVER